jgi:hypothetical protein
LLALGVGVEPTTFGNDDKYPVTGKNIFAFKLLGQNDKLRPPVQPIVIAGWFNFRFLSRNYKADANVQSYPRF